jgi:hypothetical protein
MVEQGIFSQPLQDLQPLLVQWLNIADLARHALDRLFEECTGSHRPRGWEGLIADSGDAGRFFKKLEGLCLVHYKQYLEASTYFLREQGVYDMGCEEERKEI